jgi:hypothetical protein
MRWRRQLGVALRLISEGIEPMKSSRFYCCALLLLTAMTLTAQNQPTSTMQDPLQNYASAISLFPLPPVSTAVPLKKAPLFSYSLDERVRTENWDDIYQNYTTANNEHKQLRLRTRLGGTLSTPNSEVQFNVRLANEINKSIYPNVRFNNNELIFDRFNLALNKTFLPGVTLNVGRMDWVKNGGFLFLEGNPGDGSRSTYYNLANLAYHRKGSQLELVGILDPRRDRFLGIVHDQARNLIEWDEQAIGAYYTDRNHKSTDFDVYYMLKKEIHDPRSASSIFFQPDKHVHTVGGYINRRLPQSMSIKGEADLQWNAVRANAAQALAAASWTAFGGYINVTKQAKEFFGQPYFLGGYTVLTSSEKQTDGAGFDPLFSRWPYFSEMYIYSQIVEKGVGYSTNDKVFELMAGWTPVKPLRVAAAFYQHQAFRSIRSFDPTTFGAGTNRGENYQLRLDLTAKKNWTGHILWERMDTGDFYANPHPIQWVQIEAIYNFSGHVK